jgi:hypothetical protein
MSPLPPYDRLARSTVDQRDLNLRTWTAYCVLSFPSSIVLRSEVRHHVPDIIPVFPGVPDIRGSGSGGIRPRHCCFLAR